MTSYNKRGFLTPVIRKMDIQTEESNYLESKESSFKSDESGTKTDESNFKLDETKTRTAESCIIMDKSMLKNEESIADNYESSVKSEKVIEKTEVSSACASDSLAMASVSELTLQTEATNDPTHPVADITHAATNEPTHRVANDITNAATNEPTQPVDDITHAATNEPTQPVAHDITPADTNEPTHPVANDITHAATNEPTNQIAEDIKPAATNEPTQPVANDITHAATNEPTNQIAEDIKPAATNEPTQPVANDITHAATNKPTHPVANNITLSTTNEPTHPLANDITLSATNEPTHPVANDVTLSATNEPTHPVANDVTLSATNEPTHPVADDTHPSSTMDRSNDHSVKSRDFEFWYAPARSSDIQHGGQHQHRGQHPSEVRDQNATLEGNPTSNNDGGNDDTLSGASCDGSRGLENDDHQTMNTTTTDGSIEVNLILQEGCNNNTLCGNVGENGNTNTNATGETPDSDTGETTSSDSGSANVQVPNISVIGSEVGNVCNLNFSTDVTEANSNSCNDKPNEGLAPIVTKPTHTSTEQTHDTSQSADYVNIQQLKGKLTNTAIVCNASNNIDDLTNLGANSRVYDKTNDKLLHFETNVNVSDDTITDFPRDANTSCDSGIFTGNFSDVTNASGECEDITYGLSSDDTNAEDYIGAYSQTSSQASYPGSQGTTAESNTEFKGQQLEEVMFEIQQQREINRKRNEELKRSLEGKIASIPPEPLIFLDTDRNIHYDGHGKVIDVKVIENKTSETDTSVDSGRRTKEKRNARRKGEAHTENNIRQCLYEPVCQPIVMRQTYVTAAPPSTQRTVVSAQQSIQRTAVSAPLSTQRTAVSAPLSTQRTAVSAPLSTQRTAVSAPLSIQQTAVSAQQFIQPAIKSTPRDGLENVESVSPHRQASTQAVLHERNAQIEIVSHDGNPRAGIKQKEVVPQNKNQEVSKELKGRKRKYEDMRLRNLTNVKTSEIRQLPIHRKERDESNLPVQRTTREISHQPVQQNTREISQPLQATAPPWPGEAHDVIQPAPNPVPARSSSMTRLYPVLPTLVEGQEWSQRNTTPSYATPQQEMSNVALSTNPLSIIHQTTNPQHLNPHILITNEENTATHRYNNFTTEADPSAGCVTPLTDNTGDNYQVWYTSQEQGPMTGQPEDGTPHVFNGKPPFSQGNISKERSLKGQVPNYLPFSIIVTLVCCFPVGAIALCFAMQAKKEEKLGLLATARRTASQARVLCVLAVLFGLMMYAVLLYFVITNVTKTMRSL
ncbi:uncharacterized protein LOC131942809 [Physella acuta]|uniref:uncharacterized protein LOC131942809 n=1 Tax=Physella acuta TaxID=109671 RepID=UPI0027DB84D2|nr:uncharacterized protein LOC131942809 [Physella acuta]